MLASIRPFNTSNRRCANHLPPWIIKYECYMTDPFSLPKHNLQSSIPIIMHPLRLISCGNQDGTKESSTWCNGTPMKKPLSGYQDFASIAHPNYFITLLIQISRTIFSMVHPLSVLSANMQRRHYNMCSLVTTPQCQLTERFA